MKNELLEMKKQRVKMLNKMREEASKYTYEYMYRCNLCTIQLLKL